MTFFLGVLSILMMVVFPGAIVLKLLKADQKLDPWLFAMCIFALSLVMNLVLVFGLTLIHEYRTGVLQNICALECLGFILLYQNVLDKKVNWLAGLKWLGTYPFRQKPIHSIALLLMIIALLNWLSSFGTPFGYWDATVSYNRWATDFAANQLPSLTWHYPQLLSANWSITYVLMGPQPFQIFLEFFPACIQGFFFVGTLALFGILARPEKTSHYLMGMILTALIFDFYYWVYLNTGYADIPVMFFNFLVLVCSVLAYGTHSKQRNLLVALALIFAFGAAMTKPAGIYTALILPVLHELFETEKTAGLARAKRLFLKYSFLVITVSPWYIYSSLHETNMGHFADISFLVHDVHNSVDALRWYNALYRCYMLLVFAAIALVFQAWVPRKWNLIFYCYIPYSIIWFIWFSYDSRNIELFVPIVCLNAGFVLSTHWSGLTRVIRQAPMWKYPIRVWMVLTAAFVVTGFYCITGTLDQRSLLVYQQTEKNYSLHALPFTMRLYAYTVCPGFQGQVLTDYAYFNYLPLLKDHINIPPLASYNKNMEPGYFENLPAFLIYMKANPQIHYLLLNHNFDALYESPLWNQYYQKWLSEKKINEEFIVNNVGLYKINVSNDQLANIGS
jgi:hypothetical protein